MLIREYIKKILFGVNWQTKKSFVQAKYQDQWNILQKHIKEKAIFRGIDSTIVLPRGLVADTTGWIIDIRNIVLDPVFLSTTVDLFWNLFEKEYPFQVGGQEVASIPLIAGIVKKSQEVGKPVSGFIIRKERKNMGLQKRIEGTMNSEKIILVDDVMNSGASIAQQIILLEKGQWSVCAVFVICAYKKPREYAFLWGENIRLISLFTLHELGLFLGKGHSIPRHIFTTVWKFAATSPDLFHIVPKSTPVLSEDLLYYGTDNGQFYGLKQSDGSVLWNYNAPQSIVKKPFFSSPSTHDQCIYVAAKNGSCYAFNKHSGALIWTSQVGGETTAPLLISPLISKLCIFVSVQHPYLKNKGEIACLDADTGQKVWESFLPSLIRTAPVYVQEHNIVVVGDTQGTIRAFHADTGMLVWEKTTSHHITTAMYDSASNRLLVGTISGNLLMLNTQTGNTETVYKMYGALEAKPVVQNGRCYIASYDEHIYCIDLHKKKLLWKRRLDSSISAPPLVLDNSLYAGTHGGKIYEISTLTGEVTGTFFALERVVNPIVHNKKTGDFFLTTHANEIYCLRKTSG